MVQPSSTMISKRRLLQKYRFNYVFWLTLIHLLFMFSDLKLSHNNIDVYRANSSSCSVSFMLAGSNQM